MRSVSSSYLSFVRRLTASTISVETGTIVSLVVDLSKRHLFAFCVFSRGHIQYPDEAKGNKREDIDQWRELAKVGNDQTDSEVFSEDAKIDDIYEGRGDLDDIEDAWPTL